MNAKREVGGWVVGWFGKGGGGGGGCAVVEWWRMVEEKRRSQHSDGSAVCEMGMSILDCKWANTERG